MKTIYIHEKSPFKTGSKPIKVLMVLNHAPDYRESFLSELAKRVELTVIAKPCQEEGLSAPGTRGEYRYLEIPPVIFPGAFCQPGIGKILIEGSWDCICVNANMRNLSTLWLFLVNPGLRERWIWWGPIFGRSRSKILSFLRGYIIKRSAFCLVYSKPVEARINKEFGQKAISFNNTEIRQDEFHPGKFSEHPELRLLFVGRNQPRKKLHRLVDLAERRPNVSVRLVGPGMDNLKIPDDLLRTSRVEIFGRTTGNELIQHFDWADLVANPGHVGLLVMNAARHGKGIVIDESSEHAPEYFLAKESGQPFIDFSDNIAVDSFIDRLITDRSPLALWSKRLQDKAKAEYTIEHMVEAHLQVFESVRKKREENSRVLS